MHSVNQQQLEKLAIAMHCNVTVRRSGLFLHIFAKFVLHMRTDCYIAAADQNSDIAIRFRDSDFWKESATLEIRLRFHALILTFYT